jgi:hypothetical protein
VGLRRSRFNSLRRGGVVLWVNGARRRHFWDC